MTAVVRRQPHTVTLSVRETRMIAERILLTNKLPMQFVPSVVNCILYSQAMGLGGLPEFQRSLESLAPCAPDNAPVLLDQESNRRLDARGRHAWLIANDALDLAIADFRRTGRGVVTVSTLAEVGELCVAEGLAERHHAGVVVETGSGGTTLRVVADGLAGGDAVMQRALLDGFTVPRELWRALYQRSGEALTPDSIESRRHAGPVMVDADGRVHGRDDDDTDFELLLGSKANERA
jgi:hypothetical protein